MMVHPTPPIALATLPCLVRVLKRAAVWCLALPCLRLSVCLVGVCPDDLLPNVAYLPYLAFPAFPALCSGWIRDGWNSGRLDASLALLPGPSFVSLPLCCLFAGPGVVNSLTRTSESKECYGCLNRLSLVVVKCFRGRYTCFLVWVCGWVGASGHTRMNE